jgi:hypothetical protein
MMSNMFTHIIVFRLNGFPHTIFSCRLDMNTHLDTTIKGVVDGGYFVFS